MYFQKSKTARPQSQFLHSCICERFIYSHDWSSYFPAAEETDCSWEYINRPQKYECRNFGNEAAQFHLREYLFRIFGIVSFQCKTGKVCCYRDSTCSISTILWMNEWNQHSSHIHGCFSNRIGTYICCNVYDRKKVFACFIRPSPPPREQRNLLYK
jgi:hypothetical protein